MPRKTAQSAAGRGSRLVWVLWLGLMTTSGCQPSPSRPNILLFLIDDLRWDSFQTNGNTFFQSKGFERLALEGTVFRDAFATTSLCCPSRASVFSGQMAHEHEVTDIFGRLADDVPIFPDLLRDAGYENAYVGKWHLNRNSVPDPAFERWVSFTAGTPYVDPTLTRGRSVVEFKGHLTDILTNHALFFLQQPHDRPFFLTVAHLAPHGPYVPQERFVGLLDDVDIPIPKSALETGAKPGWLTCRQLEVGEIPNYVRSYYEMVAGVDESVATILDELDRMGILDDTLVVFMSDNGLHLGEHRLGDKRSAYDDSIRIPLIVRYPRWFPAGHVVEGNIALNLDIAPTVLAAAGLESPSRLRGIDLRELANGTASRDRFLYQYFQSPSADSLASCTPSIRALRTTTWKYIRYLDSEAPEEYYDLLADPLEMANRIDDPSSSAKIVSARRLMAAERLRLGDR